MLHGDTLTSFYSFSDIADGMRAEWRYVVQILVMRGPTWVIVRNPSTASSYLYEFGQVTEQLRALFSVYVMEMIIVPPC